MPTIQIRGEVTDLTPYDLEFLFNETLDDGDDLPVPFPLTFNSNIPAWMRMHFFSVAAAFDGATDRATEAYGTGGGTLISPSYVVMANHGKPTRIWFKQADGTEIVRDRSSFTDLGSDLAIAKLDSPVTTIEPAAVLRDCRLAAGRTAGCYEIDRMMNVMRVASDHSNSESQTNVSRTETPSLPVVDLQSGNSGHPFVGFIGETPFLAMTGLYSAGSSSGGGSTTYLGGGPNPSHFINEINAILANDDEELTLLEILGTNDSTSPAIPAAFSPHLFNRSLLTLGI